jgi:hypothetical protein
MALDRRTPGAIHRHRNFAADNGEISIRPGVHEMQRGVPELLSIGDVPELSAASDLAGVSDLSTHFRIAGVSSDPAVFSFVPRPQDLDWASIGHNPRNSSLRHSPRESSMFPFWAAQARAFCSSINL